MKPYTEAHADFQTFKAELTRVCMHHQLGATYYSLSARGLIKNGRLYSAAIQQRNAAREAESAWRMLEILLAFDNTDQ